MAEILLQRDEGALRVLSMNRPERRNALNSALCTALHEAADTAWEDDAVAAVLLRGEGGTFCVGGDVKDMAEGVGRTLTLEQRTQGLRRRMEVSRLLHQMPKPTVAAIAGAAAGAGLSMALACDFRIAARSAKITTAFAKVGLSGDFGGSWFLTHIVGTAKARELYLRPQTMTAEQALALGIVTEVVDDAELDARALAFARELAEGPRVTLGYMKRNLNHALAGSLETALDMEAAHHILSSMTEDHAEAAAAFVAKRAPVFKGR
ncbi:MAG: enoyl-CoA hydratase/isomerase family protein [Burkholderiales bacterium]|nr:enoyl-CoA hydratase/isomerase family protein [Burkholderiales bacterium]